jgi:uncharacterized protein YndB with AHSA1/START domain
MNRTISIAPVRKSIVVAASAEIAFEVFTRRIDKWWPKSHGIGSAPVRESIIEPFVGGRWYTTCEDGTEATVGHVRVWEPPKRLVMSWEVSAGWKPDGREAYASDIEVQFLAQDAEHTRVDLEHRGFERMGIEAGQTMRDAVDNGWPALLALFETAASSAHA